MKPSNIRNGLSVLAKLSPGRALNYLKLFLSYRISTITGKPMMWGSPAAIAIEPTNRCNLACPQCPSGSGKDNRPKSLLNEKLYEKALKEFARHAMYLTLYYQGEPFLHHHLTEMVQEAKKFNLYVATSTNGHFLDQINARKIVQSGLDKLIVSVDGTDQKTYEGYRKGGQLDRVIRGIKEVIKAKRESASKKPMLEVQFLVMGTNEHQTEEIKTLCRRLGVDSLELKSAQVYDYRKGSPFIPKNPKFARYKKQNGQYSLQADWRNRCRRMWESCVITCTGEVLPCCFDKHVQHVMGNIANEKLKEIWHNSRYDLFRKKLLKNRQSISMCRNCTEGLRV